MKLLLKDSILLRTIPFVDCGSFYGELHHWPSLSWVSYKQFHCPLAKVIENWTNTEIPSKRYYLVPSPSQLDVSCTCAQCDPTVRGRVISEDGVIFVPCVP